jgi:hypothetical protein
MNSLFLKKFPLLLIVPLFMFSFINAPDRANFSGDWSLNEGKSELGDFGGRFAARKIKAEQKDESITISKTAPGFNGGERTTTETLTFDGKESETEIFNGAKKKSVLKWADDGKGFTITYTMTFERDGQTTEIKGTETWSLANDGKSFTSQVASSSSQGDVSIKAIYDKQ